MTGTRETGRTVSDTGMESMYGKKRMKSMTYDLFFTFYLLSSLISC